MPKNEKPAEVQQASVVTDLVMQLTPVLASIILRAYIAHGAIISDADDNQAEKQTDGSVKVYVKQDDKSHKLMYVNVPEVFHFSLRPDAE